MPRHMRLVVDIGADQAADLAEEIKRAPIAVTRSAVAREALRIGLDVLRARRSSTSTPAEAAPRAA
jgi:hypothetical protein